MDDILNAALQEAGLDDFSFESFEQPASVSATDSFSPSTTPASDVCSANGLGPAFPAGSFVSQTLSEDVLSSSTPILQASKSAPALNVVDSNGSVIINSGQSANTAEQQPPRKTLRVVRILKIASSNGIGGPTQITIPSASGAGRILIPVGNSKTLGLVRPPQPAAVVAAGLGPVKPLFIPTNALKTVPSSPSLCPTPSSSSSLSQRSIVSPAARGNNGSTAWRFGPTGITKRGVTFSPFVDYQEASGVPVEPSLSPSASSFDSDNSDVAFSVDSGSRHTGKTSHGPTVRGKKIQGSQHAPNYVPTDVVVSASQGGQMHVSQSMPILVDPGAAPAVAVPEVLDEEEDELGFTETYAEYVPSKLRSGLKHPDPVIETSSLASVLPPDVRYSCCFPEEIVDEGNLSNLQLEAVVYACQRHETTWLPSGERAGYLVGDGAGVGKGRTIAGIIFENHLLGRKKALWFSVSADLKYDAERDLRDIGAKRIKVHALNKFRYGKISSKENGKVKKGVMFCTYSSLIGESSSAKGKYKSRLKQLVHWCGKDFDGPIIFDECHRAKNLIPTASGKPSKTGKTVVELQQLLPKARVIYASATGATEPRNMAYMTRLGLWGKGMPFLEFSDFIAAVERRGVGAMEILAMDMKLRGMYLARQLSFHGTTFRIHHVPLQKEYIHMYDECVQLWLEAREKFQLAADMVDLDPAIRKAMWGQFWSSHQRFFKYLCIGAKVQACVKLARESVKNGKCVVIGLQSTGEARTLEHLEECGGELHDFVSTAKAVFQTLVEKHFPVAELSKSFQAMQQAKNVIDPAALARQKVEEIKQNRKRFREESLSKSDSSNDGQSDDTDASDSEKSSSGSDSDVESESDNRVRSDEDEDFNPFLADEDDATDFWLKKQKVVKDIPPHDNEEKMRKKKEKREKRKAAKKRRKEKGSDGSDDGDSEEEALWNEEMLEQFKKFSSTFTTNNKLDHLSEFELNQTVVMRTELLTRLDALKDKLPPNALDQLIDALGGVDNVAEMTGRKGRVVSTAEGDIQYELRHENDVPLELLNIAEKERFMKGEKHIAVISEAASSGISLQSDRRAENQRRRVHITLELPWSADKAIQQFGRTHRSNQVNAPEYVFLISELAGEQRFASIVAKRLECLGALTHGDRRATESRDLSQFNLDTKYGRIALETTMKSLVGQAIPLVPAPTSYVGDFFKDLLEYLCGVGLLLKEPNSGTYTLDKDSFSMAKFLNRILGLPVLAQNCLFQYFADTLKAVVQQAKRDGRFDMGILDLGAGSDHVKKVQTQVFVLNLQGHESARLKIELHTIKVERGMSWPEAVEIFCDHKKEHDGFYVCRESALRQVAVLCTAVSKKRLDTGEQLFNCYRPNVGLNAFKLETLAEIERKFRRVLPMEAEKIWIEQYEASKTMCQHQFWFGKCKTRSLGYDCEAGQRQRTFYVLAGSVLNVWQQVECVMGYLGNKRAGKMQVIRVKTKNNQKIVGLVIPVQCVQRLIERLSEESVRTFVEK